MKFEEFKSLKKGDIVTPYRGQLKGKLARVTSIDYIPEFEYPDTFVDFEFIDPEIEKIHKNSRYGGMLDYRAIKLVESV